MSLPELNVYTASRGPEYAHGTTMLVDDAAQVAVFAVFNNPAAGQISQTKEAVQWRYDQACQNQGGFSDGVISPYDALKVVSLKQMLGFEPEVSAAVIQLTPNDANDGYIVQAAEMGADGAQLVVPFDPNTDSRDGNYVMHVLSNENRQSGSVAEDDIAPPYDYMKIRTIPTQRTLELTVGRRLVVTAGIWPEGDDKTETIYMDTIRAPLSAEKMVVALRDLGHTALSNIALVIDCTERQPDQTPIPGALRRIARSIAKRVLRCLPWVLSP